MKKVLKKIFGVFGWILFIYDVKNLFLAFMIHLAIIFFLMLIVFNNFGFWGTMTAFAFMYLGGANILMIQQLSRSNNDREDIENIVSIQEETENEQEETNSKPVQEESLPA